MTNCPRVEEESQECLVEGDKKNRKLRQIEEAYGYENYKDLA